MKKPSISFDPFILARVLIMLEVTALAVSTAAASAVEVLIYLTFIGFAPLRRQVFASLKQPMVIMTLCIWAMVGIGVLYSAAPAADGLDAWGSWRKCLLLPLAAAVYDDPAWKKRFILFFISLMTLAALISFGSYLMDITIYRRILVGIVVSNHATQSMYFTAAAFACLILLRFSPIRQNWLLWASLCIMAANLIFITPGRSGYLALLVCMTLFTFWATTGGLRIVLLAAVPMIVIAMLAVSPVARQKIQTGLENAKNFEKNPEYTSMGIRMILWKNTLAIVKAAEHPVFGYGTDGFKVAYIKILTGKRSWKNKPADDPHNQYLKILVEYGFVGLILFLAFLFSFLRQKVDPPYYYLGCGILAAWSATSLFNGHFSTFHEGRFFFVWCAVMLAQKGQEPVLDPTPPDRG